MSNQINHPSFLAKIPLIKILDLWKELCDKWKGKEIVLFKSFEDFEVIPLNYTGSRFGHDSIRLEGSFKFIKICLIMLLPLKLYVESKEKIEFELFMFEIDPGAIKQMGSYSTNGKYCCYLRMKTKRQSSFDELRKER